MKITHRQHALIAGISLIIMAVAAMFAFGYVFSSIEEQGDPTNTWTYLNENKSLYITSLLAWLIVFITDLLVTVSLYFFFRDTRNNLSLATAIPRLIYTIFLGIALSGMVGLLTHFREADVNVMRAGENALEAMNQFQRYFSLGLIIFGLHLLGLGFLSLLKKGLPNFFGYLLLLAGVGYILIHGLREIPNVKEAFTDNLETILMIPMALGELLLAIWLIVKGGKVLNYKV